MKRYLAYLLLLAATAHAQDEEAKLTAQRARLAEARSHTEAQYKAEEKACYSKFAVNDCLAGAKARRRQAVEDLRRQEIVINDAERKLRAAERRRSQEERDAAAQQRQEAAKSREMQDQERQERAGEKAGQRASQAASAPQKAAQRQQEVQQREEEKQAAQRRRDEEAAANVKEHEKALAEAQERKDKQQKRIADRKKPPASSLPTPP